MPLHEVRLAIAHQRGDPYGATTHFLQDPNHGAEYREAFQSFQEALAIWGEDDQFPGAPVVYEGNRAWARPGDNGTYQIIVDGKVVREVDTDEALAGYVQMLFRE